jgi:methyl-accepting chemotaxis protein
MNFLDNLKLNTKTLIPLVGMAVLIVGLVAMGATQLAQLQAQSSRIIEHNDPAIVYSVRANKALMGVGYDVYQILANIDGTHQAADVTKDFDKMVKRGDDTFDQAADSYPEKASDFSNFKARFDAIVVELQEQKAAAAKVNGLAMGSKDSAGDLDSAATVIKNQLPIDQQIQDFSKDITSFNDQLIAQNKQASQALAAASAKAIWTMILLGAISIVGGLAAAMWMTSTKISKPIARLADGMRTLAGGDFTVEVDGQGRRDEIGLMAKAVQVFKDNGLKAKALESEADRLKAEADSERGRGEAERRRVEAEQAMVVKTLADNLSKLARGDLTTRIDTAFEGQYAAIRTDFNAAVDSLRDAMAAIANATGAIRGGSDEIASATDDLSKRTEQQAASLEETAAALDQITATVKRSADGAVQAAAAASGAKVEAEQSGDVMREAVNSMSEIEQSSGQISQIIGVIDEIAFQTNLLALNAGVEAARAGDAGRGFAVVAQEVRALAQRSADAAKEIKTLIASSSSQVERGVKLVGQTGQALTGIVAKVAEIDKLVSDISRSAQEQATGLAQVNTAVNQMDQVTQQNAAMVEQATAASSNLKSEAVELGHLIGRFQTGASAAARPPAAPVRRPASAPSPVLAPRRGGAAVAVAAAPSTDSWEEF